MRVLFFGRSSHYSLVPLRVLAAEHDVVGVVESAPSGIPARGRWAPWVRAAFAQPSLAAYAWARRIPYLWSMPGRSAELLEFVRAAEPDVGCIASFAWLIPPAVIATVPSGILNLHPSLLPRYRGPLPNVWERVHGDAHGGVTLHFIDDGEDTGDIVAQTRIPIAFGSDGALHARTCGEAGAELFAHALAALSSDGLRRTIQRQMPCPFRARSLRPGEALFDWRTTPLPHVFHILRGTWHLVHLLPPEPFPLRAFAWRARRFSSETVAGEPGTYVRRGGRLAIRHAQGTITLEAIPSLRSLRPGDALRSARS